MPTKKGYISSEYGQRLNLLQKNHIHKGIDIAYKTETDTLIAAGKVTFSGKIWIWKFS